MIGSTYTLRSILCRRKLWLCILIPCLVLKTSALKHSLPLCFSGTPLNVRHHRNSPFISASTRKCSAGKRSPTSFLQTSVISSLPYLRDLPPGINSKLQTTILFSYFAQNFSALTYHKTISRFLHWSYIKHLSSLFLSSPTPRTIPLGGRFNVPTSGPLCADLSFIPRLSLLQPHRFLTSSLVHGNLFHLILILFSLQNIPFYLSKAIGEELFLLVFLVSTIVGNIFHYFVSPSVPNLGASVGICGLHGILWVIYIQSRRSSDAKNVLMSTGLMLVFGYFNPVVSNASHIGGFIGGAVMGWLSGPRFKKAYRSKRDPGDSSGFFGDRIDYNPALRTIAGRMEIVEPRFNWRLVAGTIAATAAFAGGAEGVLRSLSMMTKVIMRSGAISRVRWFH
uniref:Peptidase S54 rhomboid domain-containing protein n=1 Tax=Triparma pacifica TaxID=91992 RepID=A0A7S2QV26_9STRA|mmetsp:Transcript_1463/g.2625  ORF Transcript_1463/g.2625 Transcript_1463/m.2625 type:complete len:394 (+) Transcript_1463:1897-3078(+)